MKDRSPFGIAALWENWQDPTTWEWVRTFVVLTTPSNDLVSRIHDRMPAVLNPGDYERWLGLEPDPRSTGPIRKRADDHLADFKAGQFARQ